MKSKSHIFLDIDGVLTTTTQFLSNPKKWNDEYHLYRFDKKCVDVFNSIIESCDPIIILSSDWQEKYDLDMLNRIFEINGIKSKISDVTGSAWGVKFKSLSEIEECRAYDILQYVITHKITNYLALDDLYLSPWMLDEHFEWIPVANEGIKQSGLKNKILKKINNG